MDASFLFALAALVVGGLLLAWWIPRSLRSTRRRQAEGDTSLSGIGAGWDAVWAPTSHDAERDRNAQREASAPAPSPGEPGGLDSGPIVIRIPR